MFKEDGTEVRTFPNGYDVRVVRKQDILDCIDDNIIDKDIALELVSQCEIDAAKYLSDGKWTGLPYLGNVKIREGRTILENNKELLEDAKSILDEEKYVLFRKRLVIENKEKLKHNRYVNYVVSKMATLNRDLYNKLLKERGETFTKLYFYGLNNLEVIGDCNNMFDKYNYDKQ